MKKVLLAAVLALLCGAALAASGPNGGYAVLPPQADDTLVGNIGGTTNAPVAVSIGTALAHNPANNRTSLGFGSPTDDTIPIGNGTVWQSKTVPDCQDTGGNHLNYTQSSNTLSCGTSGGGGGSVSIISANGGLTLSPSPLTGTGTADLTNVTATSHQWFDSVVSGLFHKSQPAFTDILGTIAAAQLPNPTVSTLGGVQSLTCGGGQFLNVISTSGVPACGTPSGAGNVSTGGTLTSNALIIGGGTQTVSALGSLGTTTTLLHGNAAGAPTFGAVNLAADVTGILGASNGGAGTITGALKGNGSGTVSQAACADLSNAAASCSTDTTSASNISAGTLAAARGGAGTINGVLAGNGSGVVSQGASTGLSDSAGLARLAGVQQFTGVPRDTKATVTISTATFTPDFGAAVNFSITLTAACPCTLANPSNLPSAGNVQTGIIEVKQGASPPYTITTFGSAYVTVGGTATITLSSGANAVDYFPYYISDGTNVVLGQPQKSPTH